MAPGSTAARPLIRIESVSKSFGAVRALQGVSVDFLAGQVHGLVGANGAGKSTLLNVLGGSVTPDSGTVAVDGHEVGIASPRAAAALGFAFISQELALVPDFSAIDNMTLPTRSTTLFGLRDASPRRLRASEVAERLGMSFDLRAPVRTLSVAERGMVAIGRALVGEARFLAMDEPTASLSDVECSRLFAVIRDLSSRDVAIAYVSHRLDEIEDLCDVVTVFKDGQVTARAVRNQYTRDDLILGITGARTVVEATEKLPEDIKPAREPVLAVHHLSRPPRVQDVSFTLHRGEILGLAGVVGAGRTETARIIFGADRPAGGAMTLFGRDFAPSSVSEAIARGVALVPEERRSQALVMNDSVLANINMGNWRAARLVPGLPFTSKKAAEGRAKDISGKLGIKMAGIHAPVTTLSGGNQQKVVFARWLSRKSVVLLLDEPTRGVDVGARHQVWQSVERFAADGNSVLVICSELAELSVCHRVIVMFEGRNVAELEGPGVTEDQMNAAIYSMGKENG